VFEAGSPKAGKPRQMNPSRGPQSDNGFPQAGLQLRQIIADIANVGRPSRGAASRISSALVVSVAGLESDGADERADDRTNADSRVSVDPRPGDSCSRARMGPHMMLKVDRVVEARDCFRLRQDHHQPARIVPVVRWSTSNFGCRYRLAGKRIHHVGIIVVPRCPVA